MKKTLILMLVFLLVVLSASFAAAEDVTCTDEQKNADACTQEYAPVCGDDGETYSNICTACASGNIDEYEDGECAVDDDDNETEEEEEETVCTTDADCSEGYICDEDNECEVEDDDNETEDEIECVIDADCEEGYFCDEESECEEVDDSDDEVEEEEEEEIDDDDEEEEEDSDETGEELDDDELEEEEEEDEIEDEAKLLQSNLGAKVRLIALEKKLMWAIARGEIVVENLEGDNISDLNDILDDLSAMVSEIQDLREQDELSVDKYVELRKDSWSLVMEFKKIVWENTSPEERQELVKLLKEADYSFLDGLRAELKERVREHNAEKAKEIAEKLGLDGDKYERRIKAGEMTPEQARNELREEYKELAENKREEVKQRLDGARLELTRLKEEALSKFQQDTETARQERDEAREEYKQRMEESVNELRKNIRNNIEEYKGQIADIRGGD